MHLSVPQRNVADTKSFPVNPEEVTQWLAGLQPLENSADAWEVYRGLKHSNRLHNDVDRRRAVISCFIPVLLKLHASIKDLCRAQPMPLTREFRRSAKLLDGLLREEALAFKLLISDSEETQADDLRRAMMALSRQAESCVSGYQKIPAKLLLDANQLYSLAEQLSMLEKRGDVRQPATLHHYMFIQWLAIADLQQIRARQLPLVMQFLRAEALLSTPLRARSPSKDSTTDFGLQLHQGACAVSQPFLLKADDLTTRWLNITPLIDKIESEIAKTRNRRYSQLGADTLEKQSLIRLLGGFSRARYRRSPRRIVNRECNVTLGQKPICAQINYIGEEQPSTTPLQQSGSDSWVQANFSVQGSLLEHGNCSTGLAQVGELVCLNEKQNPSAKKARVGIVRWIRQSREVEIQMGVEFLAKGVIGVAVTRAEDGDTIHSSVADEGMIISCRINDTLTQTILLPAYLYQTGDVINTSIENRNHQFTLAQSLQSNGLFGHFALAEIKAVSGTLEA